MSNDKQVISGHEFQQQLQLGWGGKVKAAKITMSTAGKNQNVNNARWLKVIKMYRDYLIHRH
ncbi:MAG TPA: hypothetical protein ENK70_04540 [Methylophaga sp.]|nr:MAG: hypothetical protein DRQ35_04125 [Gammaproteobacteria bacterium]HHA18954.1 hypothetical protein [Methylophaga sp.]